MGKLECMDTADRERLWPQLVQGFKDLSHRLKVSVGNMKLFSVLYRHTALQLEYCFLCVCYTSMLLNELLKSMLVHEILDQFGLACSLTIIRNSIVFYQ